MLQQQQQNVTHALVVQQLRSLSLALYPTQTLMHWGWSVVGLEGEVHGAQGLCASDSGIQTHDLTLTTWTMRAQRQWGTLAAMRSWSS